MQCHLILCCKRCYKYPCKSLEALILMRSKIQQVHGLMISQFLQPRNLACDELDKMIFLLLASGFKLPCSRWYEQKVCSKHKGSFLMVELNAVPALVLKIAIVAISMQSLNCIFMQSHQKAGWGIGGGRRVSVGNCNQLEWPSWILYHRTTQGQLFSKCSLCFSLMYLYGKKYLKHIWKNRYYGCGG